MLTYRGFATPARRALSTNSSASSIASLIYTVTEPTGDGVIPLATDGGLVPDFVKLWPFGLGSDDDAFTMRVIGWAKVIAGDSQVVAWLPTVLCDLSCTVSTAVGVAGSPVLATERFADTITVLNGLQPKFTDTDSGGAATRGTVLVCSPTGNVVAHAVVPLEGFAKFQLQFDQTTGTPTMNALYSLLVG